MKQFLLSIIVLLCSTSAALATDALPQNSVWYTPTTAVAGDHVMLNALVYNDTTTQATVNVVFTASDITVASVSGLTVPSKTAKVATVAWVVPPGKVIVTATVAKAFTSAQKELPSVEGVLGTVTIGIDTLIPAPDVASVKGWTGNVVAFFERFRQKALAYYTDLQTKNTATIDQTTVSDIKHVLDPKPTDTAPAAGTTSNINKPGYITYAYATAGKAFFARAALYYVVLIILALVIIRFIFKKLL